MLAERGLLMRQGTIVDAVLAQAGIIAAPPSTKNKEQARDPEMHQTKKGNQWHFGMGTCPTIRPSNCYRHHAPRAIALASSICSAFP
jgi:IS5 family transposase